MVLCACYFGGTCYCVALVSRFSYYNFSGFPLGGNSVNVFLWECVNRHASPLCASPVPGRTLGRKEKGIAFKKKPYTAAC